MEILHDTAHTNLLLTGKLIINGKTIIDEDGNFFANHITASSYTDRESDVMLEDPLSAPTMTICEGNENESATHLLSLHIGSALNEEEGLNFNSFTLGGKFNLLSNASNSIIIGGDDNFLSDTNFSFILGGHDNFINTDNSIAIGANCDIQHDSVFMFNSIPTTRLTSQIDSQAIFNTSNGILFNLPNETNLPPPPDNFGSWCLRPNISDASQPPQLVFKINQLGTTYNYVINHE